MQVSLVGGASRKMCPHHHTGFPQWGVHEGMKMCAVCRCRKGMEGALPTR